MDISKHLDYGDFVWAIELNRFCLELVGLWPQTDEVVKNNVASDFRAGIAFFILVFISVVPLTCSLLRIWGNMMLMIDNLHITLHMVIVSLQIVIIRRKRIVLASIVKTMAEDWIELKVDAEKNVMMRRARTARLIVICVYLLTVFGYIIVIILPMFGLPFRNTTNLTSQERLLPLDAYYFYDTDKSPQFELTYIVQAVSIFISSTTYTSVDAFLGLVIFHICAQLENFRFRLIDLVLCEDFDGALRNNVKTHLRLIRFAKNIEDLFTLIMLALILYFGIAFCLCGFLLLAVVTGDEMNNTSLIRISFAVTGVVVLSVHAFLYCSAGEIIAEQCEEIYHAMYDLHWYKLETRKVKTLIMLMIRAKEPLRITAGKIFPLTMTTFCSLLKTSVGYISFLFALRG